MTKITFNRYQWIGKIIVAILLILVFPVLVIHLPNPGFRDLKSLVAIIVTVLIGFLTAMVLLPILFLPLKATINEISKGITIKFLLLGSRTISLKDISGFYTITVYTKSEYYSGILVCLKNEKTLLLSNFNLADYKPVLTFFENSQVTFLGKGKYGFFSYYRKCIK